MKLDTLVSRSLDLKLTFEQIYFLITGDYSGDNAIKVIYLYVEERQLSEENFIKILGKKHFQTRG